MSVFQALILGLVQGLTEFLPVSSSGHLELGHRFLGLSDSENLFFVVVMHCATVLSTIVVFRKNLATLFSDFFARGWNDGKRYVFKLLLSTIPVFFLGLFLNDQISGLFHQNLVMVGIMLIITSGLLLFAHFTPSGTRKISYLDALIIGFAQAVAVIPGISRSGATISTGIILRNGGSSVTRFSFLMVLVPIVGAFGWELVQGNFAGHEKIGLLPLATGFLVAFITGLGACKAMVKLVTGGKLIYFGIYCFILGLIAIFAA